MLGSQATNNPLRPPFFRRPMAPSITPPALPRYRSTSQFGFLKHIDRVFSSTVPSIFPLQAKLQVLVSATLRTETQASVPTTCASASHRTMSFYWETRDIREAVSPQVSIFSALQCQHDDGGRLSTWKRKLRECTRAEGERNHVNVVSAF